MKRLSRIFLITILILPFVGFRACEKQQAESVQRQFALNTNRVASGTGDALRAIDQLRTQGLIDNRQAIGATQKTQLANAANGKLIQAAQQYIKVVDGKRVFLLTDDGVVDIQKAIDVAVIAFNDALSDPVFSSTDSKLRQSISAFTQTLALAVKALLTIKGQLKPGVAVEVF